MDLPLIGNVSGDDYIVYTPDTYGYGVSMFTTLLGQVLFEVTACSDVFMALSLVPGDLSKDSYEIAIGAESNSRTFIRSRVGGQIMASAATPRVLSCTESR